MTDLCQFYTATYISDVIIFVTSSELSQSYKHQLEDLEKDMKETEAALSVSLTSPPIQESKGMSDGHCPNLLLQREIEELHVQNQALLEKFNSEESRRKSAEKSQVLCFPWVFAAFCHLKRRSVSSSEAVGT